VYVPKWNTVKYEFSKSIELPRFGEVHFIGMNIAINIADYILSAVLFQTLHRYQVRIFKNVTHYCAL
jgi:hypothetical protein